MKKLRIFLLVVLGLSLLAGGVFWWGKTSNPLNYQTIGEIPTPMGYERIDSETAAYGDFLRSLPLKSRGSKLELYTGGHSNLQMLNYAVIDLPLLSNAEQCADACMRLRAEYLYDQGLYSKIKFADVNGKTLRYQGGQNRKAFESYLRKVYGVASTFSLSRSMPVRKFSEVRPGDVFVYAARRGERMGHAVMVVDVARNPDTGKTAVLLAEGNTPARSLHVMRNWKNPLLSPWFSIDETASTLHLYPFVFDTDNLRHF